MQAVNTENITGDLTNKVVKGSFWLFSFQVLDNILGFVRLIILARILSPNDFGLVGIAWLILQIINNFTQTGFQQALIHKPNIDKYLNTAWTYLLFRGVMLYIILFFTAPFLGEFFNAKTAIPIIQVIGLTLIFEGFMNIGTIYFQKNLAFNKQFILQISGNFVDFIVAIILAIIYQNVWVIIYGALAGNLVRLLLSYILSKYRPKFEFNFKSFKELNNYGKWIGGSNILQFIYSQGDDLLVGKILGTTSLGFYQLAYRISNLPATQITHIISTVMFPAYSKMQNAMDKLKETYLINLQITTFFSFFAGTMIMLFAYDFTILFLGKKWLPMVPAMQILTVWGVIRSIGATTGPVWQALGTPKIITKVQSLQVLILIIIIYPLTITWNIAGTSWAVVISAWIPNMTAIYEISKTLNTRLKNIINELSYSLIASIAISIMFLMLKNIIIIEININSFIFLLIICSIGYLISTIILNKLFSYNIYNNLLKLIKPLSFTKKYNKQLEKLKNFIT